jgi:glycosyltransferase involved in cell wall biosynthesis
MKSACIWEVNAPVEEMRTNGATEKQIRMYNKRRRNLARLVDAAICISDEMEEYARSSLGIKKTYVIPNGSDFHMFSPDKRDACLFDKEKYKLIWIGSPEYRWQGINIVRNIADRLRRIDNDILVLATANGESTDNLHYLGRIPYEQMPRYIAASDAGLCIYDLKELEKFNFYKNFFYSPLKLFDYMACGLPVIGNNVGQIKLVIENNYNGVLTDSNVDNIIEKIIYLKRNKDLGRIMGERGRKAVISNYNWGKIVSNTEKIIADVNDIKKNELFTRSIKLFIAKSRLFRYRLNR